MAAIPPPGYTPPPTQEPQRGDRSTFSIRLDPFITWLKTGFSDMSLMVANAYANAQTAFNSAGAASGFADNAQGSASLANDHKIAAGNSATAAAFSAASALSAPGTSATSTTSLTIGTGSQTLSLAQTGKQFTPGQTVVIPSVASPDNQMIGVITAFNSGTGAMTVNVSKTAGTGTFASWAIALQGKTGDPAAQELTRLPRSSNTIITAADCGKYFDVTGTFTQTFDTPASLGSKWFAWYSNGGTGDITIPASDGVTNWVMYPGAVRLFQCDGTTLRSIPVKGGKRTWSSSGTHIIPPGIPTLFRQLVGAGGGGGSGYRVSGGGQGGSGGAGGQYSEGYTHGIAAGTSVPVTIGAGGAGGAARTTDGSANSGGQGGNTTFGSYASALGALGGSASAVAGTGLYAGVAQTGAQWILGDGAPQAGVAAGAVYAGAGSPTGVTTTGGAGYRSLFGGGGGGGGGGSNDGVSNVNAGGAGGATGKAAGTLGTNQGFGAAGGVAGVSGSAGTNPVDSIAGHGGGGGGSSINGTAGSGGAGGVGAGGGGGGYTATGTSGAGGNGGNGICVVTEVI